jgi:hypothetical protein
VSGKSLNRGKINSCVEHVANPRPPAIVRTEQGDLCLRRKTTDELSDGTVGHAPTEDQAPLSHRVSDREKPKQFARGSDSPADLSYEIPVGKFE